MAFGAEGLRGRLKLHGKFRKGGLWSFFDSFLRPNAKKIDDKSFCRSNFSFINP